MKPALPVLVALGLGGAALTVTPAQHDFGKAVVGGVAGKQFTVSSTVDDSLIVWLTGANPNQFILQSGLATAHGRVPELEEAGNYKRCEYNAAPVASCQFEVTFRPGSVGVKTAILEISNKVGMRARVPLRGEGIVAGCQPVLVACNYVGLYTGSIQIRIIDSTSNTERKARFEDDFTIQVNNGVVTCSGTRLELEVNMRQGVPVNEIRGQGAIAGSGMLAVEFQRNSQGNWEYVLTYACPFPRMTKTSTDFASGNSESGTFPGGLADWRSSERMTDPQTATGDTMSVLKGRHANADWDPDNQQGKYMEAVWELRRN